MSLKGRNKEVGPELSLRMPTLILNVPGKETGRGNKEWPGQKGRLKPKSVPSRKQKSGGYFKNSIVKNI